MDSSSPAGAVKIVLMCDSLCYACRCALKEGSSAYHVPRMGISCENCIEDQGSENSDPRVEQV